jgi:hypothetical protein
MSILEALGMSEFPAPDSLKKILKDSFVQTKITELVIEHFAAEAIATMHPVEKAALLKRIGPPPVPAGMVLWSVQQGTYAGTVAIHGSCGRCHADTNFFGKPADAQHVIWSHCTLGPSKISEVAIEEYKRRYIPNRVSEGR